MTSANVFNLNSVKQGQTLNANAAAGKGKAENPEAASVFASMMNGNYSTNLMVSGSENISSSVNVESTDNAAAGDAYERYQYRDNAINPEDRTTVSDKISSSEEELTNFEDDVIQSVAKELDVDLESVTEEMQNLGLTVFDLLNPQNLAKLAMQLTGENSPAELLTSPDFLNLMQDVGQMADQLMTDLGLTSEQMDELVAQMDVLEQPIPLDERVLAETLPDIETDAVLAGAEVTTSEESDRVISLPKENTNEMATLPEEEVDTETEVKTGTDAETDESLHMQEQTREKHAYNGKEDEKSSDSFRESQTPSHRTTLAETGTVNVTVSAEQLTDEAVTVQNSEASYLSIDAMDLIEQIAENVRVSISEGTSSMEMQLNPENLGKVYLQITSDDGVIHARMAASNETVKTVLEAQLADLRQNLNQAGVKVDAIEVTVASHEFEKNLEQNQSGEKRQGERQEEQHLSRRRNLNLSSLDELSGLMTEEETLVAQMMRDNGNSVDLTA